MMLQKHFDKIVLLSSEGCIFKQNSKKKSYREVVELFLPFFNLPQF